MPTTILDRPSLQPAARAFAAACHASREHNAQAAAALATYGDHGSQISAIVRDHFPDDTKARLRELANLVREHGDEAWRLRPSGVRYTTMRALSRAVARRDGSGFYGPQP